MKISLAKIEGIPAMLEPESRKFHGITSRDKEKIGKELDFTIQIRFMAHMIPGIFEPSEI